MPREHLLKLLAASPGGFEMWRDAMSDEEVEADEKLGGKVDECI